MIFAAVSAKISVEAYVSAQALRKIEDVASEAVVKALFLLSVLASWSFAACRLCAEPVRVIIVTSGGAASERGYTEFLQGVYRGNVEVLIEPGRYDENLSDKKKTELESADLIIVSRDNGSSDYNGDADFWNALAVPILNHNIKLARSDDHRCWDWLDGGDVATNPFTHLVIAEPNDPLFEGLDVASGTVQVFAQGKDIDTSDQASAGNGIVVARNGGNVAIARWLGTETSYYDGSDYAPGGPRLFFAMPKNTYEFFEAATDQAKAMLKNAILSLRPVFRPTGDIDLDGAVDLRDLALFSSYRGASGCAPGSACAAADFTADGNVGDDDLAVLAANWLAGVDVTAPEPNVTTWQAEPSATSEESLHMAVTPATDGLNGVEYYFQCTSGNGPDSGWQYGTVFEPNGLALDTRYTYRARARDTSSRLNAADWSSPAMVATFGIFRGIADASAGVAIDASIFVTAGDETNRLCIYDSNLPGSLPVAEANLAEFLNIDPAQPESDFEGATWFNDRIFWITSHGRNRNGKYWYSRYQFFATTITSGPQGLNITVDGNYTHLAQDLIEYDSLYNLGLADAIGVLADGRIDPNEIPQLAPKDRGLNIEGLCTTAEGDGMFIGFRNPRPKIDGRKMALLIKLNNPEEVVLDGAEPDFDPPLLLDLDGYGIRSIEYSPRLGEYLLVAGSHKGGSEEPLQILYRYDMVAGTLTAVREFPILTPEGMFELPGSDEVFLLSDDGMRLIDTPQGPRVNKFLPREQRTFRTQRVTP